MPKKSTAKDGEWRPGCEKKPIETPYSHKNPFNRFKKASNKVNVDFKRSPNSKTFYKKTIIEELPLNGYATQYREITADANGHITTTSPGKTRMYLTYSDRDMDIYTDDDDVAKRAIIDPSKFNKKLLAALVPENKEINFKKPPKEPYKFQKWEFDKKVLLKVRKEKKKNHNKRTPDQKEVMGITAANAARVYGLDPNDGFEIGHKISNAMQGNKSQVIDNLVLITVACNTVMMALELYLINEAYRGKLISVAVKSDLYKLALDGKKVEITHLAEFISYKVQYSKQYKINGRTVNIHIDEDVPFDPLLLFNPPEEFGLYYAVRFKTAEESAVRKIIEQENKSAIAPSSSSQIDLRAQPFYSTTIRRKLDFESAPAQPAVDSKPLSFLQSYCGNQVVSAWNTFASFFSSSTNHTDAAEGADASIDPNNNNNMQV